MLLHLNIKKQKTKEGLEGGVHGLSSHIHGHDKRRVLYSLSPLRNPPFVRSFALFLSTNTRPSPVLFFCLFLLCCVYCIHRTLSLLSGIPPDSAHRRERKQLLENILALFFMEQNALLPLFADRMLSLVLAHHKYIFCPWVFAFCFLASLYSSLLQISRLLYSFILLILLRNTYLVLSFTLSLSLPSSFQEPSHPSNKTYP